MNRWRGYDIRTLSLFAGYVVVLPTNLVLTCVGVMPLSAAFLLGLGAFNRVFPGSKLDFLRRRALHPSCTFHTLSESGSSSGSVVR